MRLDFSRQIFEKTQIPNLLKIPPLGAELFYADDQTRTDGRTDKHDEANSRFLQFYEGG